jgi:hypothetical protein
MTLASQARKKTTHYFAFAPVASPPNQVFPVLYLLHGAYDGYTAWKDHAGNKLCDLAVAHGLIIVLPDGEPFGWYADSPFLPKNQIETYFMDELIPHVEQNLPANGVRGVAGLSMGGHGAVVLALRHNAFSSVSSMSGILDITRHKTNWKIPEVFGPYDQNQAIWRQHSAYYLAQNHPERLKDLPLLFTVSLQDQPAYAENEDFHDLLSDLGVDHYYRVSPGGHDWNYWLRQLPKHVAFHARFLNRIVPSSQVSPAKVGVDTPPRPEPPVPQRQNQ